MINVGVTVSVGSGVREAVTEGRKVQVGRGVGVIVLVDEAVSLGAEVIVTKNGVFVGGGVAAGREIKVKTMLRNINAAMTNKIITGTR